MSDRDAAEAMVALRASELKAPRSGRIQYLIAHPGEVLPAGGKILNLVDLSDVYLIFFLPETAVGKIALDSEVRLISVQTRIPSSTCRFS